MNLNAIEQAKRNAALEAVKHVKDGFIVGLGSGSTVAHAIIEIGKKTKQEKLGILAVPTSYHTFLLAVNHGIRITTLEEHPMLDLAIDGADQIDEKLNLIKGMGGAFTREKVVANSSREFIIIADETKRVKSLGERNQPVPIEVLPFAMPLVMRKIGELHGKPVMREGTKRVGPVITDNGNFIIDADFGLVNSPAELEQRLKGLTGVVETGLFVNVTDTVYFGAGSGAEKLTGKRVKTRSA